MEHSGKGDIAFPGGFPPRLPGGGSVRTVMADELVPIIERSNPYGSMMAGVQDDGRVTYLYLVKPGADDATHAVWVANHVEAPEEFDVDGMRSGIAPLMPREGCRHPRGLPGLERKRITLEWFQEGDGVALFYDGHLMAVVPPWAGYKGFPGYSAEAIGQHRLAWELSGASLQTFTERLNADRDYWAWRRDSASWQTIQKAGLSHLSNFLGPCKHYWSADAGGFPPRGVANFTPPDLAGVCIYATVGMSAQPMPQVEMVHQDPGPYRRVELACATTEEQDWAAQLLTTMSNFPWKERTWFGDGQLVSLPEFPVMILSDPPARITGALFTKKTIPAPKLAGLTDRSGERVTYLWVLRINQELWKIGETDGPEKMFAQMTGRTWVHSPADY